MYIGGSGIEKSLATREDIPYFEIDVKGLPRSLTPALVSVGAKAAASVVRTAGFLRRERVDAVFAAGGFVSFPACAAAAMLKIPLFLHEQNAIPGLVNRMFLSRCAAFFESIEIDERYRKQARVVVRTGNPVRPEIARAREIAREAAAATFGLDATRKTLFVFGGSGGARKLNLATITAVRELDREPWAEKIQLLHALGRRDYDEHGDEARVAAHAARRVVYRPFSYIETMAHAYAIADLVLCRAGATTIAELTATGRAAILVPYPYATDDHQRANAAYLARQGAAAVVDDADFSTETVIEAARSLVQDDAALEERAARALALGVPDAAVRIASYIISALESRTRA